MDETMDGQGTYGGLRTASLIAHLAYIYSQLSTQVNKTSLYCFRSSLTLLIACSMVAIILFTVYAVHFISSPSTHHPFTSIVKEGGPNMLLQVGFLICGGALIANIVCFGLWPTSATVNLQNNMIKTLDSFSMLLEMITNTFLLEAGLQQPSQQKIQRAAETHQASFTSLKKTLAEARSEALFGGPSKPGRVGGRKSLGQAFEDAIDCLTRLGQHLNGLRSGTRLQYELTRAHLDGKLATIKRRVERNEQSGNGKSKVTGEDAEFLNGDPEDVLLKAAADMFGDLVDDLGPPLKALSVRPLTSLSPYV